MPSQAVKKSPHRASSSNHGGTFDAIIPGTNQKVVTSAVSAQSSAFGSDVSIIRVFCTADTYLKFGSNPTATTSDLYLPAGIVEYFGVTAGEKVAALRVDSDGALYVTEGST